MITDPLMDKMEIIYNSGYTIDDWSGSNEPRESLIYGRGKNDQVKRIKALCDLIYTEQPIVPRIVAIHLSKSVALPVTCFRLRPYDQVAAYVFIRDNFYDIKVVVVSDSPISIPYHLIYTEWTQEKYDQEKAKCLGYAGDDVILKTRGEENGRKEIARRNELLTNGTDDWYNEIWSGGFIVRKNGRIYRAEGVQKVYCEGIEKLDIPKDTYKVYQDGMNRFGCSVGSYCMVGTIIECIGHSLEEERYKRNVERRQIEDVAN